MALLTWDDFLSSCKDFVQISDRINDGWYLGTSKDSAVGGSYLVKKSQQQPLQPQDGFTDIEDQLPPENIIDVCSDTFRSSFTTWEYHIVYSPSYGVPVFYFNVWNSTGKIINIDTLWNAVSKDSHFPNDKWNVLSQQEHPLLRRPYYLFHPCRTSELIQSVLKTNDNPVVAWLSSFCHLVQLKLPMEYAMLQKENENPKY